MQLVLNGKETDVADTVTIQSLLEGNNIPPEAVVVELNGNIVPGSEFGTTRLNEGDHLEVLRFVGGG